MLDRLARGIGIRVLPRIGQTLVRFLLRDWGPHDLAGLRNRFAIQGIECRLNILVKRHAGRQQDCEPKGCVFGQSGDVHVSILIYFGWLGQTGHRLTRIELSG